jgi:hypothetical protein
MIIFGRKVRILYLFFTILLALFTCMMLYLMLYSRALLSESESESFVGGLLDEQNSSLTSNVELNARSDERPNFFPEDSLALPDTSDLQYEEEPAVLEITDVEELRQQNPQLYSEAENGDLMLIYSNTVVILDEQTKEIITTWQNQ